MDRRAKATVNRDRAPTLMREWGVHIEQAKYSHDGHWYSLLTKFPAALVDQTGYLIFETEREFRESPHLALGKQISVKKPGISGVPGYIRMLVPREPFTDDVDIHEELGTEGALRLRLHLERERRQSVVLRKKKSLSSLSCEICAFSFSAAYGDAAAEYCEVHHLVPLGNSTDQRKTLLKDLAVLCANCHWVVHLRNPPFTILEVKAMLRRQSGASGETNRLAL